MYIIFINPFAQNPIIGGNMRNKLVFLGTAGDSLTLAKQRRQGGGFMLMLEGGQYHVDPGPGALAAAATAAVSARETICIVASNNSILSSEGVNEVVDAMTLGGIDRFGVIVASESVANGTANERPIIRNQVREWVERVVTFTDTTRIGINYLNIFPRKTKGLDETGLGFLFESATLKVGYTGQTSYWEGLCEQHKEVDVLIIACRHPRGTHEKGAMSVDETIKLIEKAKPRLAVLTGFGNKLLDEDIISIARSIQRETKIQTIAAKDSLEIDLDQYAGKLGQTMLKGYEKD